MGPHLEVFALRLMERDHKPGLSRRDEHEIVLEIKIIGEKAVPARANEFSFHSPSTEKRHNENRPPTEVRQTTKSKQTEPNQCQRKVMLSITQLTVR